MKTIIKYMMQYCWRIKTGLNVVYKIKTLLKYLFIFVDQNEMRRNVLTLFRQWLNVNDNSRHRVKSGTKKGTDGWPARVQCSLRCPTDKSEKWHSYVFRSKLSNYMIVISKLDAVWLTRGTEADFWGKVHWSLGLEGWFIFTTNARRVNVFSAGDCV